MEQTVCIYAVCRILSQTFFAASAERRSERDGASRLSETGTAGPAERVAVRRASLVRRSTRVEAVCFTVRATHSVPAVLCAALIHHCTGKLQSGSWFALSCDLVWTGRKTRVLGACVSGKLVPLDRTYGTAFR